MSNQPRRIKVDYVAYYFRDLIGDFNRWPPDIRGAYWSLCNAIYDAGGYIPNNTTELASVAGFNEMDFVRVWNILRTKFIIKEGWITQKRCLIELQKAAKQIQVKHKAGLTAAKVRWQRNANASPSQCPSMPSESEQNQNRIEVISDSESKARELKLESVPKSSIAISLTAYEYLDKILEPQHPKDKSTIRNFCKWLSVQESWKAGLAKALEIAQIARAGIKDGSVNNRFSYFIGTMKKELGYKPNNGGKK
jgi:uncharacterized protein YdaU (DUF1376 family)